jgi:hypothetical protein
VKHDWISDLLMIVFALIALMAVHRGTGLARELKACQQERLDYTQHVGRELCSIGRQLGLEVASCRRGGE